MARLFRAPEMWRHTRPDATVFLAGSIEMGAAVNWQDRLTAILTAAFPTTDRLNLAILNPRREDWDSSWEQSIANPRFREQVEWELDGLEGASRVPMYFDPATKSPITLLELGLCSFYTGKLLVCCPPGYWRRGNVEVVCARYEIPLYESFEPWSEAVVGAVNLSLR